MADYNFDEIVDRKNTNSLKYDFAAERGMPPDLIPLWVADMDFRTPKEVTSALVEKAEHGIFGYSEPKDEYFDAIEKWFGRHYNWTPDRKNFTLSCGVVSAICTAIDAYTKKGDGVLINQPVYYPFSSSILDKERKPVNSNLIYFDGKYTIDFEDLERKIIENNVKLYLLCSPHNPVGRVWTVEELRAISRICMKHDVIVFSDEIHSDFIYSGYKFTSYAALGEEALDHAVIATSASKTFNMAGLHNANIYIANPALRDRFRHARNNTGYSQSNVMGIVGCQAAYTYGEDWLRELLEYLEGNLAFVRGFLSENLPEIKLIEPEGTYLIWLDCSGLGISDGELNRIIVEEAKLWLDAGNIFGDAGINFQRINIACPRSLLFEVFNRLAKAFKG